MPAGPDRLSGFYMNCAKEGCVVQLRIGPGRGRRALAVAAGLAALLAAWALRGPLMRILGLALAAALVSLPAAPLASLYEKRLSRPAASLASLLSIGIGIIALGLLLVPRIARELSELSRTLPRSIGTVTAALEQARGWLEARLPGVALPGLNADAASALAAGVAGGTLRLATNLAAMTGQASMAVVLAYFFLRDRDRLLLRLELLLPTSLRPAAVRTAATVCRELRLYLRGQLMIAAAVGLLSTLALTITGTRSALALGLIIGIFNMIPYFGPYIGALPAVLIALGDGPQRAAITALALALVQQLDGAWISPRVMGSLTGFSPALVLVGIYAGAQLGGIAGMLFALPVMMAFRTLFRFFVQKCENI